MKINKQAFMEKVKEDALKRGITITEEQINSMVPEIEDMYSIHDMFMKNKHPHQIITGAFCAGVLHALGGFNVEKVDLIIKDNEGNISVDYIKG